MTKFYGKLGFCKTVEDPADSGIFKDVVEEREVYGERQRNVTRRFVTSGTMNDNVTVATTLRFIGDPWLFENYSFLKYVYWNNQYWTVSSVEVDYPGLVVQIGGLWNGIVANP